MKPIGNAALAVAKSISSCSPPLKFISLTFFVLVLSLRGCKSQADKLSDVPGEALYFPNKPVLKDVIAAVEACAV